MNHDALSNLMRDFNDIFGRPPVPQPRKPATGAYECETGIIALGIDWACRVTYDATPPTRGHTPRGERYPVEPDDPGSIDICTVHLTAFDSGKRMTPLAEPIEVSFSDLDPGQQEQIEQAAADDYAARCEEGPDEP